MAAKRPLLQDSSDEDSVATDTTLESSVAEEYAVERILLEQRNHETGEMEYLIKWEGYPLHRSTWEPESHVGETVLPGWRETKAAIARGAAEPFDYDLFSGAVTRDCDERNQRVKRRTAKREKRRVRALVGPRSGLELSGSESDNNASVAHGAEPSTLFVSDSRRAASRKSAPSPIAARKGIARPVQRQSESDGESGGNQADSEHSGLIARDSITYQVRKGAKSSPSMAIGQQPPPAERKSGTMVKDHQKSIELPGKPANTGEHFEKPPGSMSPLSTSTPTDHTIVAKPSNTGKRPSVSITDRTVTKKMKPAVMRPQRPRVNAATPKNSTEAQFKSLAQMGRYQKYSLQNEPAPDPSKLTFIDPKTGKEQKPDSLPSSRIAFGSVDNSPNANAPPLIGRQRRVSLPAPSDHQRPSVSLGSSGKRLDTDRAERPAPQRSTTGTIPSAYHRRSSSPPARRRTESPRPEPAVRTDPTTRERAAPGPLKSNKTCRDWARGLCGLPPETCPYTHDWATPESAGGFGNIECHFWRTRGFCNRSDSDCRYAHTQTGYLSRPPGALPLDASDHVRRSADQIVDLSTRIPKAGLTCYFWRTHGRCTKLTCDFAHVDTGYHAPPPPGYKAPVSQAELPNATQTKPDAIPLRQLDTRRRSDTEARQREVLVPAASLPPPTSPGEVLAEKPVTVASPVSHNLPQTPATAPNMDRRLSIASNASPDRRSAPVSSRDLGARPLEPSKQLVANMPVTGTRASIKVCFQDLTPASFPLILETAHKGTYDSLPKSQVEITVKHLIMAADFHSIIWNERTRNLAQGEGHVVVNQAHAATAESVAELCKLTASGLVADIGGKLPIMVIYPRNAEEWRFLAAPPVGSTTPDGITLKFRLFESLPGFDPNLPIGPESGRDDAQGHGADVGTEILRLNADALLLKDKGKLIEAVFLMMPQSHHAELELCTRFFRDKGCKVYSSSVAGSWKFFCKTFGKSCLVIIQPDVRLEIVPGLFRFLNEFGGGVRVFSLGADVVASRALGLPPSYGCVRLFPHGTTIYLTNEVMQYHPEKAIKIVKWMVTAKTRALYNGKLVVRLDVKNWLLDLAGESQDQHHADLYLAICKLIPSEDEDPNDLPHLLPRAHAVAIDYTSLPMLQTMNSDAKSDYLANWYAGWALLNASVYRTFIICHEAKGGSLRMKMDAHGNMVETIEGDPRGWAKQYQHIGVMTPKQVMDKLEKR